MASYKINFAWCRGLPTPAELIEALETFGFAATEEVGVLHAESTTQAVFGTIIKRTNFAYQTIDAETREVMTQQAEKVTLLPFGAFPERNILEVYEGGKTALKQVGEFFASGLGLSVVTDEITTELASAAVKFMAAASRAQLKAARSGEFAANSYMIGPYAPKFADSDHGKIFLEQYEAALKTVQVKFHAANAKATVTLRPNSCFGYFCHEDDQAQVQSLLRSLVIGSK